MSNLMVGPIWISAKSCDIENIQGLHDLQVWMGDEGPHVNSTRMRSFSWMKPGLIELIFIRLIMQCDWFLV